MPFLEVTCEPERFAEIVDEAYAGFSHADIAPVVALDDGHYLLELFHGPRWRSRMWRCSCSRA